MFVSSVVDLVPWCDVIPEVQDILLDRLKLSPDINTAYAEYTGWIFNDRYIIDNKNMLLKIKK